MENGVNTRLIIATLLKVAVVIFFTSSAPRADEAAQSASLIPVRLGVADQPGSGLVHIALEKGFFREAGLDVTAVHYPSGKRALNEGLAPGEVDMATTAGVPFVALTFVDPDVAVIASIYSADNVNRIVGREDRGVRSARDLSGKVLGTQRGSAVHYFLHSVLRANGIPQTAVRREFMNAEDLVPALVGGRIDAFSMREPYVTAAVSALGDSAVVLAAPGLYLQSEFLVARKSKLVEDPQTTRRMLRAMLKSADFAAKDMDQAIGVIATSLGADSSSLSKIYERSNLDISLSQGLLPAMDRIAGWLADEVMDASPPADYREFLYAAPLRALRPRSVSLIE